MNSGESDILLNGLVKLNFSDDESAHLIPLLEKYISELRLFNSAYNLVNTDDHDEIVIRHILDSLSAARQIATLAATFPNPMISDIGSGGGLPGIPLAAALPSCSFTLIERMSKRCAFLENAAAMLGLKNVTVLNSEAERVPAEFTDIAVFRAFRPLDKKMLKTLLRLTKCGGYLAAYKARKEKIIDEMQLSGCPEQDYKIIPLEVPYLTDTGSGDDRKRNLVLISKK